LSLTVRKPGVLSLLQDGGRRGQHGLGLTTGGPLDPWAMRWANRLVGSPLDATTIEVSAGGLELEAHCQLTVAVTGASVGLTCNGHALDQWRSHHLESGDRLALGFASAGCRTYVAIGGGLAIAPQFGSTATVVREGIGGIDGRPLQAGQTLPLLAPSHSALLQLPRRWIPDYCSVEPLWLRLVPGYQWQDIPAVERARFFSSEYQVTAQADRMGYRLQGPALQIGTQALYSEGICHGAVQIPGDGKPIVLLADRQTIGGYPKLGSVLSLDCAQLAQCPPGTRVRFTPIEQATAHNTLLLAYAHFQRQQPEPCTHHE